MGVYLSLQDKTGKFTDRISGLSKLPMVELIDAEAIVSFSIYTMDPKEDIYGGRVGDTYDSYLAELRALTENGTYVVKVKEINKDSKSYMEEIVSIYEEFKIYQRKLQAVIGYVKTYLSSAANNVYIIINMDEEFDHNTICFDLDINTVEVLDGIKIKDTHLVLEV